MSQDDARTRIVEAALAVFEERGLRDGTLGEIARRAGVGRATLYRYFSGRDALLAAVVLHEAARLFGILDDALAGVDDAEEMFRKGLATALAYLRGHRLLQRVLRHEPEEVLPHLTVRAAPLVEAAVAFAAPFVERAIKTSNLQPMSPRAAAEWAARVLLSLLLTPSVTVDLDDPAQVEAFVSWMSPKQLGGQG